MWYAPGMGKGAAGPYTETICYPSTLTWGRGRQMNLKRVENNTSSTLAPSADSISQDSPDQPAPVRCSTRTTRNQLPWRYQNFGLLTDTRPTGVWDAWVDLCVCLFILTCLYTAFWEVQCRAHFTDHIICSLSMTHCSVQGNSLDITLKVDSWVGKGVDQRTFGPIATPLPV